jgi:DNA-binding transcriptional LysR family regulator
MQMHQLLYAVSVAQLLNFSKAADHLYVTQPTLSQQIMKLEQEIGFSIFKRSTKSVSLTPSGERFIQQAKKVVAEYQALQQILKDQSLLQKGNITVGLPPLLDNQRLTESLGAFSKRYPNIRFEFVLGWSSELIEQLLRGDVDIAMLIIPENEKKLHGIDLHPFREDNVMLLMDREHPLASRESISLTDIAKEKILLGSRSSNIKTILSAYYKEHNIIPNYVYGMGDANSVRHLVSSGFGISFCISVQSKKHNMGNLLVIPISPPIKHRIAIASCNAVKLSPSVRACIEHILSVLRSPFEI